MKSKEIAYEADLYVSLATRCKIKYGEDLVFSLEKRKFLNLSDIGFSLFYDI